MKKPTKAGKLGKRIDELDRRQAILGRKCRADLKEIHRTGESISGWITCSTRPVETGAGRFLANALVSILERLASKAANK